MPDYKLYRLKITTLTPLHIGNGRELLNSYDYAIRNGYTWRINENALLDAQEVDDPRVAEMLARQKPEQLLKPADFQADSGFFRYVIKGTPKSSGEGAVLREQLKDVFGKPYLPGTAIKGALRTALGWQLWDKKHLRPDSSKLGNSPKFAASDYERELFGRNPNNDLMRALHVADSKPLEASVMMLVNVRVLNRGGKPSAPVEAEAIRREVVFENGIKLDLALFSDWAKQRDLHLAGGDLLVNFSEAARQRSLDYVQREAQWVAGIPGGKNLVSFYDSMLKFPLAPNQFFLQLGWGTGWEQKTFGSRLKVDKNFMETILKSRKVGGRYGVAAIGRRQPGDPFPKSRKIAMSYQRNPQGEVIGEIPALPLGWVLVEIA
ncbi:MAG: type III-A CRISPR-associated RAMP protein Csm5 [Anaerolineae bacterium]|nr:type III-A CRISPR-associated RAMP protein Csm5 [Anaerolineae bacterium]